MSGISRWTTAKTAPRPSGLALEPLEPRLMLSADIAEALNASAVVAVEYGGDFSRYALVDESPTPILDTDGDQTTWDSDEYIVDTDEEPGRVVLGYDESWPSETLYPTNAIEIIYTCGYGAYAGNVPESIKAAIKVYLSDLFENRESIVVGPGFSSITLKTIPALLWPYRVWLI